jgi:NAD(P)-dependent dehydrogenase (short-subunit alcohol dehydrogenase family)
MFPGEHPVRTPEQQHNTGATMANFANKSVLVTGANSGLGFEAAAQLAEAGYGRVILACRTTEKAETARRQLVERVGRDPFETLAVDVADVSSSEAAAAELIARRQPIDALLLNAGMVSGDTPGKSADGLELSFASSVLGHHLLTVRLLEANLLPQGARVVLSGSEAANDDLPGMMGIKLHDFVKDAASGDDVREGMLRFARLSESKPFVPMHHYATTKVISAWWAAAMARRYGDRLSVFTVSPGANMATNAARHLKGFKKVLFTKVMPLLGPVLGVDQPVALGAKRYIDVLHGNGDYESGRFYASAPKKMTGPLHASSYPHLLNVERQEAALGVLGELTGASADGRQLALAS